MRVKQTKDRLMLAGERARARSAQTRMDKLGRENAQLRSEVELLRDDLDHERDALDGAMKRLAAGSKRGARRAKPKLLRTILIAGGAYVLGARAGRERYDQITAAAGQATDRIRQQIKGDDAEWGATPLPDAGMPVVPGKGSTPA